MELADTVKLMGALDWKDRLKAEYWQLKLRIERLEKVVWKDEAPQACKSALQEQLNAMHVYMNAIEKRIKLYNLTNYMNDTSDMVG